MGARGCRNVPPGTVLGQEGYFGSPVRLSHSASGTKPARRSCNLSFPLFHLEQHAASSPPSLSPKQLILGDGKRSERFCVVPSKISSNPK